MRDYQAAADLIRAAYANDGNGHLGTGVHVRFEALREAIAAAIEKERAANWIGSRCSCAKSAAGGRRSIRTAAIIVKAP